MKESGVMYLVSSLIKIIQLVGMTNLIKIALLTLFQTVN